MVEQLPSSNGRMKEARRLTEAERDALRQRIEELEKRRGTSEQIDELRAELDRSLQLAELNEKEEPKAEENEEEIPQTFAGALSVLVGSVSSFFGNFNQRTKDFFTELFGPAEKKHPHGGVTDESDPEPILSAPVQEVNEILSNPDLGKRIAEMARRSVQTGEDNKAASCWNWIERVCGKVGARFGETVFRTAAYGKPLGNIEDFYPRLQEGDWLYIHNQNGIDKRGDHSVIFLGWINEDQHIAQVASFPGVGKKRKNKPPLPPEARVHTVNFNNTPITSITKPAVA